MNLKETMEIQWKVEELILKGLVRESLSPCAVPALGRMAANECVWTAEL